MSNRNISDTEYGDSELVDTKYHQHMLKLFLSGIHKILTYNLEDPKISDNTNFKHIYDMKTIISFIIWFIV